MTGDLLREETETKEKRKKPYAKEAEITVMCLQVKERQDVTCPGDKVTQ